MDLTTYAENAIGDAMFNNTALPSVASMYVAFYNGDPTDAGTGGTEVTTDIRAAGRLALSMSTFSSGASANDAIVDMGESDGAVTYTHIALFDAQSAGNMWAYGGITGGTQSIGAGTPVSIAVGKLTFTLD